MPRKSDTKKSARKTGVLSREDRALWDHVADQVSPLDRIRTVQSRELSDFEQLFGEGSDVAETQSGRVRTRNNAPPEPQDANQHQVPKGRQRAAPVRPPNLPQTALDDRTRRRISRGRATIDGRIDLHGMRQAEAESALRRFLFASHAREALTVLVITGKGAPGIRSLFERGDDASGDREPRGVLKRRVPQWLQSPELRSIVVGFGPAHQRHGGDGALYVRLKSKR